MILHLNLVMNSCLPSLFHVPHEFLPQFYLSRRKKILDSNNRVLEMERWLGSKIAQCSCRGVVFSSPHHVKQLITTWKMKIWDSDGPLSTLHSTHLHAHIHSHTCIHTMKNNFKQNKNTHEHQDYGIEYKPERNIHFLFFCFLLIYFCFYIPKFLLPPIFPIPHPIFFYFML